jgi:hypothetical protein
MTPVADRPPDAPGPDAPAPAKAPANDAAAVADADALIAAIARPPLARTFLLSLGIHLVLILLTSVQFFHLCVKYNTLDPRPVIRKMEQEAREQEQEAKRQAARERALAGQSATREPSAKDQDRKDAGEGTLEGTGELEGTPKGRPTKSDVRLDELDLE